MRLNFSLIAFVEFVCYLLIAGFFIRYISAKQHDNPIGKALAFIY